MNVERCRTFHDEDIVQRLQPRTNRKCHQNRRYMAAAQSEHSLWIISLFSSELRRTISKQKLWWAGVIHRDVSINSEFLHLDSAAERRNPPDLHFVFVTFQKFMWNLPDSFPEIVKSPGAECRPQLSLLRLPTVWINKTTTADWTNSLLPGTSSASSPFEVKTLFHKTENSLREALQLWAVNRI